jgi:heme/copper-type cytochrome/quinol oxidase subunit 2
MSLSLQSNNSTSDTNLDSKEDEKVGNFIIYFTLLVLIVFIIFFLYNLLKCYIPKWRREKLSNNKIDTVKYNNVIEDIALSSI